MSPTGRATYVLLGAGALLLAWEGYTLKNRFPEDHITAVTREAVREHPIISFLMGVLMGHLFWP